jgi:hypothetical protein
MAHKTIYETRWLLHLYASGWFDGAEAINSPHAISTEMSTGTRVRILRRFSNDRVFVETIDGRFRGWIDRGMLEATRIREAAP